MNKKFKNVESPTRKLIEDHEKKLDKFDINRIWRWNQSNIRKCKKFVQNDQRIDNKDIMQSFILYDKQI